MNNRLSVLPVVLAATFLLSSAPFTASAWAQSDFQPSRPIQQPATSPTGYQEEDDSQQQPIGSEPAYAPEDNQRGRSALSFNRRPSVVMTSNLMADVAEALAPSVVNIDVEQTRKTSNFGMNTDLLRRFFGFDLDAPLGTPGAQGGSADSESKSVVTGSGSGMILDRQGYILTNNHVVSSADKITVTLSDGRRVPARLVGRDTYSDVAVVKIDAPNLKPVTLGDSDSLCPGEWVIAVGSPLGFDHTVTQGIVSALSRRIPELNTNLSFIQTDAAINPGNSGGPLTNLNGEVVGINTAISGKGQNIGFAIPINTVKEIANTLIAGKPIVRPWLGIAMMDLNPELAKHMGLSVDTTGVVIARVTPDSPADKAGVQSGDLIRRVDGISVNKADKFQDVMRSKAPGTSLILNLVRGGKPLTIRVITGTLPTQGETQANGQAPSSQALMPKSQPR